MFKFTFAASLAITALIACFPVSAAEPVIGLITKTDSNPYFVKLREAAQAKADSSGAELVALAGAFDGDNEGQVAAIENLVGQGVKGPGGLEAQGDPTGVVQLLQQEGHVGQGFRGFGVVQLGQGVGIERQGHGPAPQAARRLVQQGVGQAGLQGVWNGRDHCACSKAA